MATETIRTSFLVQATDWLNDVIGGCPPCLEAPRQDNVGRDEREIIGELLSKSPEAFSSEHDVQTMLHMLPGRV